MHYSALCPFERVREAIKRDRDSTAIRDRTLVFDPHAAFLTHSNAETIRNMHNNRPPQTKEGAVDAADVNRLVEKKMAPRARFELATLRLTAECSTVELPGNGASNFDSTTPCGAFANILFQFSDSSRLCAEINRRIAVIVCDGESILFAVRVPLFFLYSC